jgi:hypothetical protein
MPICNNQHGLNADIVSKYLQLYFKPKAQSHDLKVATLCEDDPIYTPATTNLTLATP